jgi:glycine cleavage system regulatory protein
MLDQQQGAERGARDDRPDSTFYRRPMPGGGYVEVELEAAVVNASDKRDRMLRGRIVMERRADPSRRYGHQAPVVVELTGDDRDELMANLFQLAQDNAALARNLMRMQAARSRVD